MIRHALLTLFVAMGVANAETWLNRAEVEAGKTEHRKENELGALDRFQMTHCWRNDRSDTTNTYEVRMWEGIGMWPGDFPIILQVFDGKGNFVRVDEITINSARPTDAWTFYNGWDFVLNVRCEHRFSENPAIYAFRLHGDSAAKEGGPVTEKAMLEKSKRLVTDGVIAPNTKFNKTRSATPPH